MPPPPHLARLLESEEGHAPPLLAAIIAGGGIVALGIGAATDTGWLAIAGGIVGGAGFVFYNAARHVSVDWDLYRRTGSGGE